MTDCECELDFRKATEHLFEIRKHHAKEIQWHGGVELNRSQPYQIPASNILDDSRIFAPPPYFYWDITRITAGGFTGGTVAVYYAETNEQIFNFTSAGSVWFNPKAEPFLTNPHDRLYFVGTSLVGTASISFGYIKIPSDAVGRYLLS